MREKPVGMLEVAKMAGLTHGTVRLYKAIGLMPEPDGHIGQSPWWWPATIRAWIAARDVSSRRRDRDHKN